MKICLAIALLFSGFCVTLAQPDPAGRPDPNATLIYVSATVGNDNWTGRISEPNAKRTDGPLASFDGARLAIRAMNKGGLSSISVQFREGTYYIANTVDFTETDSGTSTTPIVYENYPHEAPVFTGGVRVQHWTRTAGNQWRATLPPGTQVFENLFYNGDRRLRPRLGGYLGQYYYLGPPVVLTKHQADQPGNENCAVQIGNDQYECFDRFTYVPGDPIAQLADSVNAPVGNPCRQNAGNPTLTGDIQILDFEQFSTSKLRVNCIDTANQIVYLLGSTTMSDSNYTQEGFQQGRRYLVENAKAALRESGQWFLDRSNPNSYILYYLARPFEDPNLDTVIVPQTTPPLLRTSKLHYVTFRGLTFEYDNFVLPSYGHPSRELETDIPPVISIQNSDHVAFDAGEVRHTSGTGLDMLSCLPGDANKFPAVLARTPQWCAYVVFCLVTNSGSADSAIPNGAECPSSATQRKIR